MFGVFWAIIRIILFFNPEPISKSLFIPEPFSTVLFFVTGFILISTWIGITYWKRSRTRRKAFGITSEGLLDLSPSDFEEMVAELYRGMGHQAKRTGSIGDHGVDVVVKAKNGENGLFNVSAGEHLLANQLLEIFMERCNTKRQIKGQSLRQKDFL